MHSASSHIHHTHSFTWKSYRLLKKKAMEQELSWSGLAISLSIAFFIVAGCATTLRIAERSFEKGHAPKAEYLNERVPQTASLARVIFGIPTAQAAAAKYQATPAKGTEYATLAKGQEMTLNLTYKNTGTATWKPREVTFETGPALKSFSRVKAAAWKTFYEPVKLPRDVKPGESVTISFPIKAPSDIEATTQEDFQLVAAAQPVTGSQVRVFVTITAAVSKPASVPTPAAPQPIQSAPAVPSAGTQTLPASSPVTPSAPADGITGVPVSAGNNGIETNILIATLPMIRVGLFSSMAPQRLTIDRSFDLYGGKELLASNLAGATAITASYDPKTALYKAVTPNATYTTKFPLRLVPKTNGSIATALDYRAGQNPQDNRFRNILELNYSSGSKTAWIINELPIEDYVKGLAETTNASPVEFQKVMATIARTYALYHFLRGITFNVPDGSTKHAGEHFHVDSVYDQVYRGYNSEMRMTGLTQAVEATRGAAVTYKGQLALTPYFSNSAGYTLDYASVWGGSGMPWLTSVPVPQDAGKTLYGHGVGLSARGALLMVIEGKGWQDVLKYFYTGTAIQKIY